MKSLIAGCELGFQVQLYVSPDPGPKLSPAPRRVQRQALSIISVRIQVPKPGGCNPGGEAQASLLQGREHRGRVRVSAAPHSGSAQPSLGCPPISVLTNFLCVTATQTRPQTRVGCILTGTERSMYRYYSHLFQVRTLSFGLPEVSKKW